MKKIVISLIVLSFLFGIVFPALIFAQITGDLGCTIKKNPNTILGPGATCETAGRVQKYSANAGTVNGATCCLYSDILNITMWISMILIGITSLLFFMGVGLFMGASGSKEKTKRGRNFIICASAGLGATLFSFILPYILKSIIGV